MEIKDFVYPHYVEIASETEHKRLIDLGLQIAPWEYNCFWYLAGFMGRANSVTSYCGYSTKGTPYVHHHSSDFKSPIKDTTHPKFKVGDLVLVKGGAGISISDFRNDRVLRKDEFGIIQRIYRSDNKRSYWYEMRMNNGGYVSTVENNIKASVITFPPNTISALKVGDVIEIVAAGGIFSYSSFRCDRAANNGELGTITQIKCDESTDEVTYIEVIFHSDGLYCTRAASLVKLYVPTSGTGLTYTHGLTTPGTITIAHPNETTAFTGGHRVFNYTPIQYECYSPNTFLEGIVLKIKPNKQIKVKLDYGT